MQDSETIEQLEINFQSLARRAFPELRGGKKLDCLLKGQFFQALITKWQLKLGAPKPEETFLELYDRKTTTTPIDQKAEQDKNQQGKNNFQKTSRVPTQSAASKEDSGRAGPVNQTTVQMTCGEKKQLLLYVQKSY